MELYVAQTTAYMVSLKSNMAGNQIFPFSYLSKESLIGVFDFASGKLNQAYDYRDMKIGGIRILRFIPWKIVLASR